MYNDESERRVRPTHHMTNTHEPLIYSDIKKVRETHPTLVFALALPPEKIPSREKFYAIFFIGRILGRCDPLPDPKIS